MATLFPLRVVGSTGDGDELWLNPEHIVAAQRVRVDTGEHIVVDVELKLVGMNPFRARLGTFSNADAAAAAWERFIAHATAQPGQDAART